MELIRGRVRVPPTDFLELHLISVLDNKGGKSFPFKWAVRLLGINWGNSLYLYHAQLILGLEGPYLLSKKRLHRSYLV